MGSQPRFAQLQSTARILEAAAFAILLLMLITNPMLAGGRAIGFTWTATLVAILALSTMLAALVCWFIFRKMRVSVVTCAIYFAAVFGLTVLADNKLMDFADSDMGMAAETEGLRIQYFCLEKFSAPDCVDLLSPSPRLVRYIPKEKRPELARKLSEFKVAVDRRNAPRNSHILPSVRQPASAQR